MFSTAFGAMPPAPDHAPFVRYEYCTPQRMPPLGPLYGLYQKPALPCVMARMSPAHVPPAPGVNEPVGAVSVEQPLLLAAGEP